MKVTIKTGKVIPPPPPKREKKFVIELSELDAARLYQFAELVPRKAVDDICNICPIGAIDIDIMNAFEAVGFFGDEELIKKSWDE
jgi:hypothetical protein